MALAEQLFSTLDEEKRASLTYKPPSTLKARLINNLTLTGGNDGKDYQTKSDVEFIVGDDRASFYGRRFVFGLLSPWFRERLYTPDKPTQLEIPDVTPDVFRCVFNCAYGLPPDLTIENVIPVLEVAQRMQVDALAAECLGLVGKNLTTDNVLTIFNAALKENVLSLALEQHCCGVILAKSRDVLASDAFLTIDPLLMIKLVESDFFCVRELTLWKRVAAWAKCKTIEARERDGDCKDEDQEEYEVGDKVVLITGKVGKVAYKGEVDFGAGLWYGIDLGKAKGDTSGTVDGKAYFQTENEDCGVFVKPIRINRKCVEVEAPPPSEDNKEQEESKESQEQQPPAEEMVMLDERDCEILKKVLYQIRFPLIDTDYFIRDVAPLLPAPLVSSVLLHKVTGAPCVFPSNKRRVWGAGAGDKVEFTVIAANVELNKAKNIPDTSTQAEWSRESMEAHNNRQYFVCDVGGEYNINKLDMKNYYGDGDTIKTVEIWALREGVEWSDEEKDGPNWEKQCEFESAKTSSWQKGILVATESISRYWKFVVTEVHGTPANYTCLDHLVLYGASPSDEIVLKPRPMEVTYTVKAASQGLARAHKLPLRGEDAEWSRVKMSDAGGPQWFIVDMENPAHPVSIEMRHRYSDNDTIKDLELYYLPDGVELTKEQEVREGGEWIKAGEVQSAQSTDVQNLATNIDEEIQARYWKFQVISLYGGGPTCDNYPCMQDMFITGLSPLWTTGLCDVVHGIRLEAPPLEEPTEEAAEEPADE